MTRLILVSACLVGLIQSCLPSNAAKKNQPDLLPLPRLIDAVRPSVVQIAVRISGRAPAEYASYFNGQRVLIVGTGLFVNSAGDVVTAFHVVQGYSVTGPDGKITPHPGVQEIIAASEAIGTHAELQIGVALPNYESAAITVASGTQYFRAKFGPTDPAHDLAVLQAIDNPFKGMPRIFAGNVGVKVPPPSVSAVTLATKRPSDGDDIFACGYPLFSHGLLSTSGKIASAWNSKPLLRASAAGFTNTVEVYELDVQINPGNSGGPVFRSSDQAVIGVVVEVVGSIGVAVPAKQVEKFLDNNKITWQPTLSGNTIAKRAPNGL
jgi:S1-C subfamily serine protease